MTSGRTHRRLSKNQHLTLALSVAEFRALFCAEVLSLLGDQLARVALSVLVFDRTGSAALTGLTYALTFVPAFLGGALFGSLGDRYSRRSVMLATDLGRAALMAVAAAPAVPIWLLCTVVAATTFLTGPFKAAEQALVPSVLPAELYTSGMALRNVAGQTAQLIGFGCGGLLIAALGSSVGLGIDAASFAASALIVWLGVQARPVVAAASAAFTTAMRAGLSLIWHNPALRALTGLVWLAAFYVIPEALAAPYAASRGAGSIAVGLVMASAPAGSVLGGLLFGKWVPEETQRQVIGVLGVLAGVPLAFCLLRPSLPASMLLFGLCGAFATAYNIQGVAEFIRRLPDAQRAQGTGLLGAGLITVQGLGSLLAGVLADGIGPARTVGVAGVAGAAAAIPIAITWSRHRGSMRDRPAARHRRCEALSRDTGGQE